MGEIYHRVIRGTLYSITFCKKRKTHSRVWKQMKYLPLTYRTGDSQSSNQICTFANFILAVTVYTVARKITYQVTTTLVLYTWRCKRLQSIERVLKATSSIHIFPISESAPDSVFPWHDGAWTQALIRIMNPVKWPGTQSKTNWEIYVLGQDHVN